MKGELEKLGVHFMDMHCKVREQVVKNEDDSYTILINARLNCEQQMEAYQHALRHIMNNDFDKDNVNEIEFGIREDKA